MSAEKTLKGYYKVKFYKHKEKLLMFFNGLRFEKFPSDTFVHVEIESYEKIDIESI